MSFVRFARDSGKIESAQIALTSQNGIHAGDSNVNPVLPRDTGCGLPPLPSVRTATASPLFPLARQHLAAKIMVEKREDPSPRHRKHERSKGVGHDRSGHNEG
jgi:hypothetical protein